MGSQDVLPLNLIALRFLGGHGRKAFNREAVASRRSTSWLCVMGEWGASPLPLSLGPRKARSLKPLPFENLPRP